MIFEYAVDPEVVVVWSRRDNYRRFMEKFGLDQRRLVSRFPKKWRKFVREAFESIENTNPKDVWRIEELVKHLTSRMPKRQATVEDNWLEAAEAEHQVRRFHKILSVQNPREVADVLVATDLDHLYDNLPNLPSMEPVDRVPEQMAAMISPLLKCADVIAFVDPNFGAARRRFIRTFECYFEAIVRGRCTPEVPRIELHIGVEQLFHHGEERTAEDEVRMARQSILEPCQLHLPRILPEGLTLRVVVWRERPGGVQLHNRYVLTNLGSVQFGHGLDCYDNADITVEGEDRPDDEITCLSEEVHQKRWRQYVESPGAFDLVLEGEVLGKKRKMY